MKNTFEGDIIVKFSAALSTLGYHRNHVVCGVPSKKSQWSSTTTNCTYMTTQT